MNRSDVCICSLVSTEYLLLLRYSNTLILLTAIHFYAIIHPLSWEKTHYLDVSLDALFNSLVPSFINKDVGNVTNYSVTGLTASVTYYYRVRAYNITGTSSNSNTIDVKLPTDVENIDEIPTEYKLYQNYPNPFNPTTKIKFGLPVNAFTKLIIYDVLGREVETLLSSELNAGYHEVEFNASKLTSGVYFYQIRAGNYVETKKLVLLR